MRYLLLIKTNALLVDIKQMLHRTTKCMVSSFEPDHMVSTMSHRTGLEFLETPLRLSIYSEQLSKCTRYDAIKQTDSRFDALIENRTVLVAADDILCCIADQPTQMSV